MTIGPSRGRRQAGERRARPNCLSLLVLLNLTVPLTIGEAVIKVTRFQVPALAQVGASRRISCLYELQGGRLHAMKLFKDNKEFYRFSPGAPPRDQRQAFPVAGVQVELGRSNEREALLRNINKQTAGLYKCQVTAEGSFRSDHAERRMEIGEALPLGQLAGEPGARLRPKTVQQMAANQRQSRAGAAGSPRPLAALVLLVLLLAALAARGPQ